MIQCSKCHNIHSISFAQVIYCRWKEIPIYHRYGNTMPFRKGKLQHWRDLIIHEYISTSSVVVVRRSISKGSKRTKGDTAYFSRNSRKKERFHKYLLNHYNILRKNREYTTFCELEQCLWGGKKYVLCACVCECGVTFSFVVKHDA